jgi:hypothetical protein
MLTRAHARKTSTITTVTGFAVIAAVLTGCSTPSNIVLIPKATPGASTAESRAIKDPVFFKTGDVVDATQAEAILKAGNGQRAYPMADGTFIVVTKTEPLPAVVQSDADAKAEATFGPLRDVANDMNASTAALGKVAGDAIRDKGKRIITVFRTYGYTDADGDNKSEFWVIVGGPKQGTQFGSRAEAQVEIDAWLLVKDNANEYAVVYAG